MTGTIASIPGLADIAWSTHTGYKDVHGPILAAKHFCEYRLLYFRVCIDSNYRLLQLFPAVDKFL